MMAAVGGDTRLGMLMNTTSGVGVKEGSRSRIGRKNVELNHTQTPDQDRYQSPGRILKDFPLIILPNPYCCLV